MSKPQEERVNPQAMKSRFKAMADAGLLPKHGEFESLLAEIVEKHREELEAAWAESDDAPQTDDTQET